MRTPVPRETASHSARCPRATTDAPPPSPTTAAPACNTAHTPTPPVSPTALPVGSPRTPTLAPTPRCSECRTQTPRPPPAATGKTRRPTARAIAPGNCPHRPGLATAPAPPQASHSPCLSKHSPAESPSHFGPTGSAAPPCCSAGRQIVPAPLSPLAPPLLPPCPSLDCRHRLEPRPGLCPSLCPD